MREWNSYSDDLTLDGNVVKEYTIRFKTTEYEVFKRIESFFQMLMDEPHMMDKCYKCRWWNYEHGCQSKYKCEFEMLHKIIDNSKIAEDAYPDLRKRLHDAVDELQEEIQNLPSAEPKKVCIGQIHFDDEKLHEIVNEAVKKLKEEIEPKQGEWIPCSERLPIKSGFYLCTVNKKYTHVRQMKLENIDTRHRWLLMSGTEVEDWFVLAWMPLPEPWKGAEDE